MTNQIQYRCGPEVAAKPKEINLCYKCNLQVYHSRMVLHNTSN